MIFFYIFRESIIYPGIGDSQPLGKVPVDILLQDLNRITVYILLKAKKTVITNKTNRNFLQTNIDIRDTTDKKIKKSLSKKKVIAI